MQAVLVGEPDLTVPMPVLTCTGASIKKMMYVLLYIGTCIGLYLCFYWSTFESIGIVLLNVLVAVSSLLSIVCVCVCWIQIQPQNFETFYTKQGS